MTTTEFLAFVPLLFYGIALAELLKQWRRFFDIKQLCWPYFLTIIMFTELAIWNVFIYLDVINDVVDLGYYQYWVYLLQPIIFLIIVNALTPDDLEKDIESYFKKRISVAFGLMAVYIACHFLPGFGKHASLELTRVAGIVFCLLIAFSRRFYFIYVLFIVWIFSLFSRG